MDIQAILETIKNYGAAIISTISAAGIAGCAAVIVKIKSIIGEIKKDNKAALDKKDEVIESSKQELKTVAEQNKALINKIDMPILDYIRKKFEGDVKNVKSNRNN